MNGIRENLMLEFAPNAIVPTGTKKLPKEIKLTCGESALVDEDDYDRLVKWKWCLGGWGKYLYAISCMKGKCISMHRFIMNTPKGLVVDHLDHNGLNNQKENLRNCTQAQNTQNMNRSKYRGVSWKKSEHKFVSKIGVNRKCIHLGYFSIPEEAARAYNVAALKYFGEGARLNKI